jgi:hypothetical protein
MIRRPRGSTAATLALGLAALPVYAAGCSAKPPGQLVLVIQTDVSIPKEIDTIRIEAFNNGTPKFQNDYDKIGPDSDEIQLPGTITLVASDKPSDAISIVVSARSMGAQGVPRIVRTVVTTIPATRTAMLPLPLSFLCYGQATLDAAGDDAISSCSNGETCIGGTCQSDTVDSTTLPDYSAGAVSGDGSCFDAATCWDAPVVAAVDATCSIANVSDVNIALQTEGLGICGSVGCFVTLDANDPVNGWSVRKSDGRIVLPSAVCTQLASHQIINVVTEPTTASCAMKQASLPTCGPWSAAAKNHASYTGPLALAGGQAGPVAVALQGGNIYWTNGGVAGAGSSLKSVAPAGGTPATVVSMSTAPRALIAAEGALLWTDGVGTAGTGSIYRAVGTSAPTQIVTGLDSPEGLTYNATHSKLFWTDFQDGAIFTAESTGATPSKLVTEANYPYRIAADDQYVYWTNEGSMGMTDGSVARYDYTAAAAPPPPLATMQDTPRAIALDIDSTTKLATAVYWATFSATAGQIVRVDVSGATPGTPEVIAKDLHYPNGILVDGDYVYWTNRDDGTVVRLAKSMPNGAPTVLATLQESPGSLVSDDTAIYWVNQGSSSAQTGAVIKLLKTP